MNCENFMDNDDYSVEDCIYVCKRLENLGIDFVEISGGTLSSSEDKKIRRRIKSESDENYFESQAVSIANALNIPVSIVGGIRKLEKAENLINSSKLELISLGRPLHSEPDIINKWKIDRTTKPKCISCNQCNKNGKRCVFHK